MYITSYPNQKMINISREIPKATKENKRPYMIAYIDNIVRASYNLTPTAFKLYLYFVSNQDNFKFALSTKAFAEMWHIDLRTAQEAVNILINKGYLVKDNGNHYTFYENPRDNSIEAVNEIRKEFNSQKEGKILLTLGELAERVGQERANELWAKAK